MLGLMMDRPLLISGLIEHASRFHGATEIVSREPDRRLVRTDYARIDRRARRLAQAMIRLGIAPGDRVASLAWNTHRHLELYFGVSGMGAVLHTVNPRLFPGQIDYMLRHAADRVVFVDGSFLQLAEALVPGIETVEHVVFLGPAEALPETALPGLVSYETLLADETGDWDWPSFDERRASMLCYTSGTTGNPKGALYSHRSTVLHTLAACSADLLGPSAEDTLCPVVPMFHAAAWGIPYAAAMVGARLALPGRYLDGDSLCQIFRDEGVTYAAGVPTLWQGALDHVARTGLGFGALKRVTIGGAAAPPSMIDAFAALGVAAGLGHDRDEPARHGRRAEAAAGRGSGGGAAQGRAEPGASALPGRPQAGRAGRQGAAA
jgi:fatty-acyl-CoA synthase